MAVHSRRWTRCGAGFIIVGNLVFALLAGGCATVPYRYGVQPPPGAVRAEVLQPGEPQIERGRPNALVDGIGWVLGIPSKIILWNIRVDNHSIGTNTEEVLRLYLERNGMDQVKVRLNQYAPGGEWRRLTRNKSVGWGWRYTLGTLSWLYYTVLPGRIFGGDNYNAFTDTISLYSDVPAIALHEGAHAKDSAGRKWRGTYAFTYMLPFVALYQESIATGDAIGYLRDQPDAEAERRAYHILYPAYSTYIGGSVASHLAPYAWVYYAALLPGHIAGRWKGSTVEERRAREDDAAAQ